MEFGAEDEESKPVDELAELTTEDLSEFSLYRETYVLTVAKSESKLNETEKSDKSSEPNEPGDQAVSGVSGAAVEHGVPAELGEPNEPDELGEPDVPDESGRLNESNELDASNDTSITTNDSIIQLDESLDADLTQMTNGKFESFAEVCFLLYHSNLLHLTDFLPIFLLDVDGSFRHHTNHSASPKANRLHTNV